MENKITDVMLLGEAGKITFLAITLIFQIRHNFTKS